MIIALLAWVLISPSPTIVQVLEPSEHLVREVHHALLEAAARRTVMEGVEDVAPEVLQGRVARVLHAGHDVGLDSVRLGQEPNHCPGNQIVAVLAEIVNDDSLVFKC